MFFYCATPPVHYFLLNQPIAVSHTMYNSSSMAGGRGVTTEPVCVNEKNSSLERLDPRPSNDGAACDNVDSLTRQLRNRHIQLIAIGGSIGTALFLSIGGGLNKGGPGSLFIAYTLYSIVLGLINNCIAEMTVYMPVSGGFIRLAGKWVDDSFGFMAGWNFFLYEALLIPFEISALSIVLTYWRDDIPTTAVCGAVIVAYV